MTERTIINAERRAKAIELLGGYCNKCGAIDNLEFDHIKNDRETKQDLLSQLLRGSWGRVIAELQRCQLLCKSCHAIKTQLDRGYNGIPIHGTLSNYMNKGCRCSKCKEANRIYTAQSRAKKLVNKMKLAYNLYLWTKP